MSVLQVVPALPFLGLGLAQGILVFGVGSLLVYFYETVLCPAHNEIVITVDAHAKESTRELSVSGDLVRKKIQLI